MIGRKKRKRYKKKVRQTTITRGFPLTPQNQITYIYKKEKGDYTEVTNVSYEIKIGNIWMTIVRFDSAHGYLHQHIRVSLTDANDPAGAEVKTGTPHEWLTFAIADIMDKYLEYRRDFFERSNTDDTYN